MKDLVPTPVIPDLTFKPVPRKHRFDGWTAERQRAFIAALAETGSVKAAADRINMTAVGAYALRRAPGGEGFAAAWAAALATGVQRLTDLAMERVIEGVPVPVFYKGEQVGERRRYNDRLHMFMLRHHLPGTYDRGVRGAVSKNAETIAREAAENCPVCKQRAEAESEANRNHDERAWLQSILERYALKVKDERRHRLAGQTVAADFTLRQLTHIELILDAGGLGMALLDRWTIRGGPYGPEELNATVLSRELDGLRRRLWKELGDPPRPPLDFARTCIGTALRGGPTLRSRERTRRAAEAKMAAAQAMWEACATEEAWKSYCAAGDGATESGLPASSPAG